MRKQKHDSRLLELARRGAQAQLDDLIHEIKMLLELFPHLRDSFDKDELPISFLLKKGAQKTVGRKKRPRSAAARKKADV